MPRYNPAIDIWSRAASGERLACLRSARDLSQSRLGEASGVSTSKVRNIEHGLVLADAPTREALAKALEVTPASLATIGFGTTAHSRNIAIRALVRVATVLGFEPVSEPRYACLRPTTRDSRTLLQAMIRELEETRQMGSLDAVYRDRLLWRASVESPVVALARDGSFEVSPTPTFGENLKRLRSQVGLTQAKLASAVGTDERVVRSWEADRRAPTEEMLQALSKALGVVPEALMPITLDDAESCLQTLLDIASAYLLVPDADELGPVLRSQSRELEKALDTWANIADDPERLHHFLDTYNDSTARRVHPSRYTVKHRWLDGHGEHRVTYTDGGVVTIW